MTRPRDLYSNHREMSIASGRLKQYIRSFVIFER